jgi:cytochrome oxidase Cu insertion factor (SCO1/SenC/PrrC family)
MIKEASLFAGVLAVVGVCAALETSSQDRRPRSAAELMDVVMWGTEPIGGPFTLVDHTGKTRTEVDFHGKFLLVYFGFTFCPDICPTDLQAISSAIEQLGPEGNAVQPLFITVDPERDTPTHLAQYVPMFHPRLIGLTGDGRQIRAAADAYKVYFEKISVGADATIDHSSFIYLMDPNGKYLGFFPPSTSAEQFVQIIRQKMGKPKGRDH